METLPRRGLWKGWIELLNRREPATALALFRIVCGLCILNWIGSPLLHGIINDVWLDRVDGGYRTLDGSPWLFQLVGGVNPVTLWSMIGVLLTAGLCLTVGLGGRIAALLALQSYLALAHINTHLRGCDDQLTENALWLLVLANATATLSVDCRLRWGTWYSDTPVSAWPRYLAIYQLVLVYWTTGLQKVSIHWSPGGGFSALYYILQEPSWQRWDMSWLAWVYPLTQIATALTWFWELSSPLLLLALWYRHTRSRPGRLRAFFNWLDFRRLFVIVGVGMHLGVFVLIGLGPFTWITLSFYVCLFNPHEWRAAWQRVLRLPIVGRIFNPSHLPGRIGNPSYEQTTGGYFDSPWGRRLVYGLVTLHVVAITLMAFPAPGGGIDRDDWKTPLVQEEFQGWAASLNRWGLDVSAGELEDWLWKAATKYMGIREKVLAPFRPYYRICGTSQGWRMFVGPNMYPTRLSIDVQEGGQWRTVYVERDPRCQWLGSRLDHEHLRTAIFTMAFFRYDEDLADFTHWLARQAARDFPEADRVRIRIYKYRTPSPEEVREERRPQGKFVHTWVIELAKYRDKRSI